MSWQVNATFVDDTEIICPTPNIVDVPIGFPVVAEVAVSINGKEQFHQFNGYNPPTFTFFGSSTSIRNSPKIQNHNFTAVAFVNSLRVRQKFSTGILLQINAARGTASRQCTRTPPSSVEGVLIRSSLKRKRTWPSPGSRPPN